MSKTKLVARGTIMRFLTAIPVYNEKKTVRVILEQVRSFSDSILVIDDGSTDGTSEELNKLDWVRTIRHEQNKGYGGALISAFNYACKSLEFDALLTMDCDGQHEPSRATSVIAALDNADIASGSRYLEHFSTDVSAPADRMQVNQIITSELNASLGLNLTDAFCGYKGYRIAALSKLNISETGWGMPLQVWVQAARLGLRIKELPVPRIYLDATRSFGTTLDNANERLEYYRRVIKKELINFPENHHSDRAPCKCMGNLI